MAKTGTVVETELPVAQGGEKQEEWRNAKAGDRTAERVYGVMGETVDRGVGRRRRGARCYYFIIVRNNKGRSV